MKAFTFAQKRMMVREIRRLRFIFSREGIDGVKTFASQGVGIYNSSLKTGYGKSYSEELKTSIIVYITVLQNLEEV